MGSVSEDVIRKGIIDYSNNFNKMPADIGSLTETSSAMYPFVKDLEVLDADGNERPDMRFSSEGTVWKITFNRDMDQTSPH